MKRKPRNRDLEQMQRMQQRRLREAKQLETVKALLQSEDDDD